MTSFPCSTTTCQQLVSCKHVHYWAVPARVTIMETRIRIWFLLLNFLKGTFCISVRSVRSNRIRQLMQSMFFKTHMMSDNTWLVLYPLNCLAQKCQVFAHLNILQGIRLSVETLDLFCDFSKTWPVAYISSFSQGGGGSGFRVNYDASESHLMFKAMN